MRMVKRHELTGVRLEAAARGGKVTRIRSGRRGDRLNGHADA
jgi:hypothetical protein